MFFEKNNNVKLFLAFVTWFHSKKFSPFGLAVAVAIAVAVAVAVCPVIANI